MPPAIEAGNFRGGFGVSTASSIFAQEVSITTSEVGLAPPLSFRIDSAGHHSPSTQTHSPTRPPPTQRAPSPRVGTGVAVGELERCGWMARYLWRWVGQATGRPPAYVLRLQVVAGGRYYLLTLRSGFSGLLAYELGLCSTRDSAGLTATLFIARYPKVQVNPIIPKEYR